MPCNSGWLYKVVGICAPFVLATDPLGQHVPLDLRRCRLARLSVRYGKKAFKRLAAQSKCKKK